MVNLPKDIKAIGIAAVESLQQDAGMCWGFLRGLFVSIDLALWGAFDESHDPEIQILAMKIAEMGRIDDGELKKAGLKIANG